MPSSLWIDETNALARVESHEGWLGEALRMFVDQGYAVIRGAVPEPAIDRYRTQFEGLKAREPAVRVSDGARFHSLVGWDMTRPLSRALDTYMFTPTALALMFSDKLLQFLNAVFEDDVLAFQSLHFEVGSTQAIHQDTAYVVVDEPLSLAAAWIALEDVQEGSGELVYYPGSHRFPPYLYEDGRRHWRPDLDGDGPHDRHLRQLGETAQARGIAPALFRPRKGDALIWHADLAHGGGEIRRDGLTRRSFVTHYCPRRNTPHYFTHTPHARKIAVGRNAVSSMYYDVHPRTTLRQKLEAIFG
ncbi:MAG: phytanoyl-CoA dioxygenase family protein [Alphaproteobacteria bacterium]|nr:phytanoyl-CoA dioxygenase family protein [Alphaproteobacteria bacterium]